MSILIVQIPPRGRLHAQGVGVASIDTSPAGTEYHYVVSPDGLTVQSEGLCPAAQLPKATSVVALLADIDVSWHRITLPRAPAARLRAALDGVLEEALLEDADALHLALAPNAAAGQPTWVAAVDRRWLRAALAALEKFDIFVERVVPMSWPDDPPIGHFAQAEPAVGDTPMGVLLHWAHADGVATLRLNGGLARALVPTLAPPGTRWSASPAAVNAAEQWLGAPVNVMPPAQRALQAARSLWNLRQFDLARRTRGARALRDSLRQFLSPEWRLVRYGAMALLVTQIVGLNLWSWSQQKEIDTRRAAVKSLVKETYPKVGDNEVQLDAAAVMQREAQALRTMAGQPGDTDLEPMLQATAVAWPADRAPVQSLRYEPGKLTLAANGWSEAQIQQFRSQLQAGGWQVDFGEGRLTLTRARTTS